MTTPPTTSSVPAELQAATQRLILEIRIEKHDEHRDSYLRCKALCLKGARDDYTWGYRIFRTSYSQPNSDAEFQKAIDVLQEYIRHECYEDYYQELEEEAWRDDTGEDTADGGPNQQLWKRLKNDIVQDREQLEGASSAGIRALSQDWVHSRDTKTFMSPRYRFSIIIDDEAVQTSLQHPKPAVLPLPATLMYAVNIVDAEFGLPPSYFPPAEPNKRDKDGTTNEEEQPKIAEYEGWFWASASKLMDLWFWDELTDASLYVWDLELRPVHFMTRLEVFMDNKQRYEETGERLHAEWVDFSTLIEEEERSEHRQKGWSG